MLWKGLTGGGLLALGLESPRNMLPGACLGCGWNRSESEWGWEKPGCVFNFFEGLVFPHRLVGYSL